MRWLPLALALGCAPSAPSELVDAAGPVTAEQPGPRPELEALCGGLAIATLGEWRTDDPLLDRLQDAWDPRGPEGEPVAIRPASVPTELRGHTFVQVSVLGGPREVVGCFVGDPAEALSPCASSEAVLMMLRERDASARPADARAWAQLLGTTDGASAVFESDAELERCVPGLPMDVRARLPRLGLGAGELAFVERLDPTPALTMIVLVVAELEQGSLRREELLTLDRGGAR